MEVNSVEAIISALNHAGVRYAVVGGLAVNAHGFERMTHDIDLVLELKQENCSRALNALLDLGYQPAIPEPAESFLSSEKRDFWHREKNMIVFKLWSDRHRRTPIDIFIFEPFPFEEEYERCLNVDVAEGVSARIVSLETLLTMKRDANRPQDIQDLCELERSQKLSCENNS